jgi:hypothetical protein
VQEFAAITFLAFAVTYIGWRYLRKRASGTCCGKAECPATREMIERMRRGTASKNR